MTRLRTVQVSVGYGDRTVISGLDLGIPDRALTAIVGPNACGKSTLLRALVRLLQPHDGRVELDGTDVRTTPTKEVARQLGFLPQGVVAPEGITAEHLVRRGRYPHQSLLSPWTDTDQRAVEEAMVAAGVTDLADRPVDSLSGGQAQRVWIAMVLAQQTSYLLLDEPTTFLDIAHQYELLELLSRLRTEGRTVVTVLHDLNQACRFADHIIAMRDGRVVAEGRPAEIVDAALVEEVFGLACLVVPDPVAGTPMIVPHQGR